MSRRRRVSADVEFWPGFTDVLSGMLLAMVFVLTLFVVTQAGLVHVVGGKDAALRELEEQLEELRVLLQGSEERSESLETELAAATALVDELSEESMSTAAEVAAARLALGEKQSELSALVAQLREYNRQIQQLSSQLSSAEEIAENRRLSLRELQLAMNRLRQQLGELSSKLRTSEEEAGQKAVRLSELIAELARKDRRIAELETLERYTSEFLAKMTEVFADNPNIKVVGDRFVFQSEVLFASGSANIGPAGRAELARFARAFRQLMPRIPRDLDVNVQVQGHTDVDPLLDTSRFANNWELSTARALGVVKLLASMGIPDAMMSASGFGEHAPRVAGDSTLAKAQNRRIEIRITRR